MGRSLLSLLLAVCLLLPCLCARAEGRAEIPDLAVPRLDVPDSEAMAFLRRMGLGWNLGNTFDAIRSGSGGNELNLESAWCGVKTTEDMIAAVQEAGFTTLRIPVSWHNHVSGEGFTISEPWLNRVQQVVDWAYSRGMYVILNTHHDIDQAYCYPLSSCYETSERYLTSVWTQLAERFREYDEHLLFETMNEPRLAGTSYEWGFDARIDDCRDAADCIVRLNQAAVNAIRATGGENAARYILVPAYDASAQNACSAFFRLPEDTADNRLIVSVHAYTPYSFALQEGGVNQFSLKSARQTREIDSFLDDLYRKYIVNGIPVAVGEFGARDKGGNLQSRVNFAAYYVAQASARGIPCLWWDNNAFSGNGENFGLLRRLKCTWLYPDIVEAMTRHAAYDPLASAP